MDTPSSAVVYLRMLGNVCESFSTILTAADSLEVNGPIAVRGVRHLG